MAPAPIDTGGFSEARDTGFEARMQGEPISANPYEQSTWEADEWTVGWCDADDMLDGK